MPTNIPELKLVACIRSLLLFGLGLWLSSHPVVLREGVAQEDPPVVLPSSESKAFTVAVRAFEDAVYDRAEEELKQFVATYPDSERLPEAILLQARSALRLKRPEVATQLLKTNLSEAGFWTDRYQYWLAEVDLYSTNYQAAANGFAKMIKDYPDSPRVLDASYREAWVRYQMGDSLRVIQLLEHADGAFQNAVKRRPGDVRAREGYFLLAEALLRHERYADAEKSIRTVTVADGTPEAQWRRQHILCRIQIGANQLQSALATSTNLLAAATASGRPLFRAESVELQAGILATLGRQPEAVASYEQNLLPGTPEIRRRHALFQIVELTLAQDKADDAIRQLTDFFAKRSDDPAGDIVLMTLGELHLSQTAALVATNGVNGTVITNTPTTNHLQQALARFNSVISGFPNSPLIGKAHLGKGWCLWAGNRISEGQVAFQTAVDQLPPSYDHAVALFKLADTQIRQSDFTNAIISLKGLTSRYSNQERVKERLFGHAHYQILRAAIETKDLGTATSAMRTLLSDYPESDFRDPGLLLVVQAVGSSGQTDLARSIFDQYTKGFPDAPLLPEVQLALARTHVQDRDWKAAIGQFDQWIARFPTNSLRARAEFDRAWVYDMSGRATNAFNLFTNFVSRFPTNQLAPSARFWVGDFFYQRKKYVEAQIQYQKLVEAFPGTPLAYRAKMMAGRAAFALGFWNDAAGRRGHFIELVADENCPPDIRAEAYFALGDTIVKQGREGTNTVAKSYGEALVAFKKIPTLYPTNQLVPLAWGRVGDCHLQLATTDPAQYELATNAYLKVLQSPLAGVATRSQAEVGLGIALEKQAQTRPSPERGILLNAARDRFLNVLYGSNLKEGETPDPFWLKESGLAAARMAESQNQWSVAANYYKRLAVALPAMKEFFERRLERVQAESRQQKGI